jgi:CRP-like cAMP-binding protein
MDVELMSTYESGVEGRTGEVVVRQFQKGLATTNREEEFSQLTRPNQGLTNQILASLPAPEFSRLLPFFEPVALRSGEEVHRTNDSGDFVYFPETVVVSHLYSLHNGGATGAAVIGNDGMIGLSNLFESGPPAYRTVVMIGGEALRVRTEKISAEFARGASLQRLVLSYVRNRLEQVSQRAVCNGRHKLAERLCTWLLMVDDRAENRSLMLTQADIANHLGARRTVITGCCNVLRTRGAISYKRGHIIILDRKRLEAEACECYEALNAK